jgi:membrane associated rhomboid family serine protease
MFVPVWDDNPLRAIRFQFVTLALIALNIAALFAEAGASQGAIASFAVVPRELFSVGILGGQAVPTTDTVPVAERWTLLTYMFLHGDLLHLASNMVFLWVFGDNIEDALGHGRFLVFYLLCGIFAALVHSAMMPTSPLPLIGASGAVAGVVAAYLILHPRVQVWVLAFRVIPLRLSAAIVLGLWVATQLVMLLLPQTDLVAWWAHVGGLIAGAALVVVMRRSGVPLFDKGLSA